MITGIFLFFIQNLEKIQVLRQRTMCLLLDLDILEGWTSTCKGIETGKGTNYLQGKQSMNS